LHVPTVQLEKVASFVQRLTGRPLGAELGGAITLDAKIARDDAKLPPTGEVTLAGKKTRATSGSLVIDPLDWKLHVKLDPPRDATAADERALAVNAFVRDATGELVSLDASTRARWSTWMDVLAGKGVSSSALDLPASAKLVVPERPIAKLPAPLRGSIP